MGQINKHYFVNVSYDGTNFHGWAKQLNLRTVQQEIENVLTKICDEKISIFCAGRTDAYVHALDQCFDFKTKKDWKPKNLQLALNALLPNDIHINKVKDVNNKFHSRFNAVSKTYLYVINKHFDIFKQNYELFYNKEISLKKIKPAIKLLVGKHNFLSFSRAENNDTVRTINFIKIRKTNNYTRLYINGNGFLRNMVRMIVGNLLAINENRKSLDDIKKLLNNPKKGASVDKVKGCGLYLYKVFYG